MKHDQEQEHWVAIPGYEGYYEVSDLANIRSIPRRIPTKAGYLKPEKERILIQRISNKGYLTVKLSKNGRTKTQQVHRMLALAFIPDPDPGPKRILNHKDGNKLNNSIENLEWCTYRWNAIHAYKMGLYKSNERRGKLIVDMCTGERYTSIKKAALSLKMAYSTCRNYLSGHSPNPTCLQYAA